MKFKIPEIKIPKAAIGRHHRENENDEPVSYEEVDPAAEEDGGEVLDELEDVLPSEEESKPPQEKPKSYGMVISEDQLRMVWAGEIGFSLLIVLASVLISIAS